MKKLLLSIFILSVQSAFSQTDTAFWFAAPDISASFGYDRPIAVRLSSFQTTSVVTVSQPANVAFISQTITLPPFSTGTVFLTSQIDIIECGPGNVIQNRGLKITSNNLIAAYYEANVDGPNPELFALKGRNALGTQFYISSQNVLNNADEYAIAPLSSFNIVASENNTSVTITTTKNITGHAANIPFTIILNKGQTYAAIATSLLAGQHLDGSYVTSTKPIAITLADDLLNGGIFGSTCRDLAGDQTIPISVLGTEYIAIKSNLSFPYDKLFITATQNGTTVSQDGVTVGTINAGQSTTLTVNNASTYIQTSFPAYVYHLAGAGCEVGAAVLPKIDCTGSGSISVARSSSEPLSITLLVKNGGQGNFLINNNAGIILSSQFAPVPATGGQWYFAKISLSDISYPNGSIIKVTNTTNLFQMGFLQGQNLGLSFGYFSDYNSVRADATANDTTPCAGSNLTLNSASIPSALYSWTGPGGFTANTTSAVLNNVTPGMSGNYIVNVTVPGCGIYRDTVTINVLPKTFITINQSICEGQSYAGYSTSGQYVNTFMGSNSCDSTRTLNLIVKPRSYSAISQTICDGQTYFGHTTTGIYNDTLVAANGCDSVRTLTLTVKPRSFTTITQSICEGQVYQGYSVSGTYVNTFAAANGCDSIRTLNLTVRPKSYSTIHAAICTGGSYHGYTTAGTYVNTFIGANGCDSIRTLNLTVNPTANTTVNQSICQGQTYAGYSTTGQYVNTFTGLNGCDSIRTLNLIVKAKSFSSITQIICDGQVYLGHTETGIYLDTLVAANGCDSIRTLNLTVNPKSLFTLNKTICEGQTFEGYSTTGTFINNFTAANGCDSIWTLNLVVKGLPNPDLGPDKSICVQDIFSISPGLFDTYLWQNGSAQNNYIISKPGIYSVKVTNSCGSETDTITITEKSCEIFFPNVFTPNSDSKNDVFRILNAYNLTDFSLIIYNRWGEKVFETDNFNKGWDGMYKGLPSELGTYVWLCSFKKGTIIKSMKGSVLLLR